MIGQGGTRVLLEVKNFSKRYKNNANYSAKNISFTISEGEVVGLVGSNGAGKSTIIKSIIGVLPFRDGTIKIGGFDINKRPERAKKLIGYVPDDHSVYEKLTGREYINYMGSLYGATKKQKKFAAEELAEHFGIKYALDTQIASYSHGMRQKICILGALVHRPKLWILDEPMVGLDHQTMMLLCRFIRDYADGKHAVLFSSHNLDVVRKVCDKVVFIKKGRLENIVDLREQRDFDLDGYYMEMNGTKDSGAEPVRERPAAPQASVPAAAAVPAAWPANTFGYPAGIRRDMPCGPFVPVRTPIVTGYPVMPPNAGYPMPLAAPCYPAAVPQPGTHAAPAPARTADTNGSVRKDAAKKEGRDGGRRDE